MQREAKLKKEKNVFVFAKSVHAIYVQKTKKLNQKKLILETIYRHI